MGRTNTCNVVLEIKCGDGRVARGGGWSGGGGGRYGRRGESVDLKGISWGLMALVKGRL